MSVDHVHSALQNNPKTPRKKKRRLKNAALTDQNRLMLLLGDGLALVLALTLSGASSLLLGEFIVGAEYDLNFRQSVFLRLAQFVLFSGFFLIWMNDRGHYDHRLPFWTEARQVVVVFSMAAIFDGFLQYLMRAEFSRVWLVQNWAFAVIFVLLSRSIVKSIMQSQGSWSLNTVIVGSEAQAEAVIKAINAEKNLGYKITRIMAPWELALIDGSDYVKSLYSPCNAQFVLLAMDSSEVEKFGGIISSFIRQRLPFAFVPPTGGMPVLGLDPIYFFNHDLVLLTAQNNLAHPFAQMVKRAFDIVAALAILTLLLTVFLPLILVIVIGVMIDGGPIFYHQARIGHDGKPFRCLKFRSMIVNAERALVEYLAKHPEAAEEWRINVKLRFDPRITWIGRFLRKSSLDELPQLLNVLRGEMSLVGPRPIVESEIERYGDDVCFYYEAKPGMTGLWQVSGRNDVDYATRVRMDSWYVKNWTLWHDIVILFKTIPVVYHRKGS